jgi:hypothetical protein
MTTTTLVLLSDITDGVPSGNYDGSSLDWYSDPQRAVNYYRGQGHIQTLNFGVTDFAGIITIEATLESEPPNNQSNFTDGSTIYPLYRTNIGWFEIAEYGDGSTVYPAGATDYRPISVEGKFTWVRARVRNFVSGTINIVDIRY